MMKIRAAMMPINIRRSPAQFQPFTLLSPLALALQPADGFGVTGQIAPAPFCFSVPQFASGDEEGHIHSLRREWTRLTPHYRVGVIEIVGGHFPFALG